MLISPGINRETITASKPIILASLLSTTHDPADLDATVIVASGQKNGIRNKNAGPNCSIIGVSIHNADNGIAC